MAKIKVLIIDDSAVIRKMLADALSQSKNIEVVGSAIDPFIAANKIKSLNPDVLTLDVEMPRMDGITFLSKLMIAQPMPVVMVSSLTEEGAEQTIKALETGAVDFIAKPKVDSSEEWDSFSDELIHKITIASKSKIINRNKVKTKSQNKPKDIKKIADIKHKISKKIIAIGASTGGTEVISRIVTNLPETVPGIAIAQHMPEKFTYAFATRLNSISDLVVKEAENGDRLYHGVVLIAPGNRQMEIRRDVHGFFVEVNDKPAVNNHKPSVDVLMQSVAEHSDKNTTGIILTGMGNDGAKGLLDMKKAGAITIAQDKESSAIFGMPAEAVRVGGADYVKNIEQIIDYIKNIT